MNGWLARALCLVCWLLSAPGVAGAQDLSAPAETEPSTAVASTDPALVEETPQHSVHEHCRLSSPEQRFRRQVRAPRKKPEQNKKEEL